MREIDIVNSLQIKAQMIDMGERIALGSDTALMREAATEIERLRKIIEEQWLIAHDVHCTNMRDCSSYGGTKFCHHPRPTI